jgi:hypothetical protein
MRLILITLLTLFLAAGPLSAQWGRQKKVNGSGNIEKQERKLDENFTAVKSCCSMMVMIKKGSQFSVIVETDDNLLKYIETEVSNGRLSIRRESNINIESSKRVKVYVTMPEIDGLYASSSSDLLVTGDFKGDELDIDVSSSAEVEVNFTGAKVTVEGSSSGRVRLAGSADRLVAALSSSSRVEAQKFTTKHLKAKASSSGKISVGVTEEIEANVSSSGQVNYSGSPQKVFSDASSSGKVRKIE